MEADFSVELGPDAPALELPWQDPDGQVHYVELYCECGDRDSLASKVDRIPEARQFPALRQFLIDVNSQSSAWQTAKCDVWTDKTAPEENLYGAGFTHNSYVDLALATPNAALRSNLDIHYCAARELAKMMEANEAQDAYAEIVVRRCYFHCTDDPDESDDGYCLTLFLNAYGAAPEAAATCWASTMKFASECLLRFRPEEACPETSELS